MQIPWILLGDFNQVQTEAENFSKNSRHNAAQAFQSALFQVGLLDIHIAGSWFTWTNKRVDDELVIKRLDKAFSNKEWLF